jgi:hypothetical protein
LQVDLCSVDVCIGGNATFPNRCVGERTGLLCAGCPAGSTPTANGSFCTKCDGVNLLMIALICGALFGLMLFQHASSMGSSSKVKLTLYFVQIGTLLAPAGALGPVLMVFGFRLSQGSAAVAGQCLANLDTHQTLLLGLGVPIILFTLLTFMFVFARMVLFVISRFKKAKKTADDVDVDVDDDERLLVATNSANTNNANNRSFFSLHRYIRTLILLFLTTYTAILNATLAIVACTTFVGKSVLSASPSVPCEGDLHLSYRDGALSVFVIIGIIAPLLVFSMVTYWRRKKDVRFGVLCKYFRCVCLFVYLVDICADENYKSKCFWWEPYILARRFVISLIIAFSDHNYKSLLLIQVCGA